MFIAIVIITIDYIHIHSDSLLPMSHRFKITIIKFYIQIY